MITKNKKYDYNSSWTITISSVKWTGWLRGDTEYQKEIVFTAYDNKELELERIISI